jgi:hypothetical protein
MGINKYAVVKAMNKLWREGLLNMLYPNGISNKSHDAEAFMSFLLPIIGRSINPIVAAIIAPPKYTKPLMLPLKNDAITMKNPSNNGDIYEKNLTTFTKFKSIAISALIYIPHIFY